MSTAALAVLVPLAVHQAWDYVEVRRLIAELEAIATRHEPLTRPRSNATLWPGPTDAGTLYAAAGLVGFDRKGEILQRVDRISDRLNEDSLDRSEIATERLHFERLAETYADAFRLADKAAGLPYDGPPEFLDPLVAGFGQSLSRLLAARTMALAMDERGDEALASVESAIHSRRAVHEAWFSLGEREVAAVLSLSAPSAAALQRTQAALEAADQPDRDVERFLLARARYIGEAWRDPGNPRLLAVRSASPGAWVWRPWVAHHTVASLRIWSRLAEVVRLPWPERVRAAGAFQKSLAEDLERLAFSPVYRLTGVVMPFASISVEFFVATNPKPIAIDRSARVALAIERYRRDNEGRLPDSLSMLVPTYLASIPADPYSGGPLRYRTMPGAYTIYSVGDDGRDDRGDLSSVQARVEAGSRVVTKGRDVGLRVWLR